MEPSDRNLFQSVIKMVDSLSATGNYDTIINVLSLLCLLSVLNRSPNTAALSGGSSPFSTLLGELMKGTNANTNTVNSVGNSANNNPLAGMLGELLKGGNGNTGAIASPFAGILGELMKGGNNSNNNTAANPLGNILGELFKGSHSGDNTSGNPLALIGILGELLKGSGNSNNTGSSPLGGFLGSALSSPDLLMSLLPLLGGLQNKAKSNNAPNIASVMGILNNLSGLGGNTGAANNNTQTTSTNKNAGNKSSISDLKPAQTETTEKKTLNETAPDAASSPTPSENALPAPVPVIPEVIPFKKEQSVEPVEAKSPNRFLKWKTNF